MTRPAGGAPRIRLQIDSREVLASAGQSVMQAALAAGIRIPGLCASGEHPVWTSCMVCLVRDGRSGRFIPSCSARVEEGMVLESDTPEVQRARRASLELLLAEHHADCLAPCTRACPAHPDIPELMRALRRDDLPGAARVLYERIPLPGVTGCVCRAPCERSCRRRDLDESLGIRDLERFLAGGGETPEGGAAQGGASETRGLVVVIGAGPAGLSTAFHLLRRGYGVRILDQGPEPGGGLRTLVPAGRLPHDVLSADLGVLRRMGAEIEPDRRVEPGELTALRESSGAVVVATGEGSAHPEPAAGIFICGAVVRPTRMVARSLADGLSAALAVDAYIRGESAPLASRRFDSHGGRLVFPSEDGRGARLTAAQGASSPEQALGEAARCLQCDCAASSSCRLRELAGLLAADQKRHRTGSAVKVHRELGAQVVHEPAKCILCGKCVAISRGLRERYGMAFRGRGLETTVAPPFGRSLDDALPRAGEECARACPTGALTLRGAQAGRHSLLVVAVLAGLLALVAQTLHAQAALWPVFRGGPALTGATTERLPRKPRLLWVHDAGAPLRSTPVVSSDAVFVGTMGGKLLCLSLTDGRLRWSFDARSPLEGSPLYHEGAVYVGSSEGVLFAVDAAQGRILWQYRARDRIAGAPNRVIVAGGTLIVFGSYDGTLEAVDGRTGVLRWSYATDNFVNGAPAVTADGRVVFGGCDGFVHVLRAVDGVSLARVDSGAYIAGSPAVEGARAYVANYAGKILAADTRAAALLWSWEAEAGDVFYASPALSAGRVLAGSRDGRLYCLDAETGSLLWTFRTGASIDASVVVAPNGVLLASGDGMVYAADPASGKELWSYEAGGAVSGSPAVAGGRVLFGSEDGRVYVLGD